MLNKKLIEYLFPLFLIITILFMLSTVIVLSKVNIDDLHRPGVHESIR